MDLRAYLGLPISGKVLRLIQLDKYWVIDQLLPPMGRVMLSAPSKVGKTLLALQLAHCIASGKEFLGLSNESGPQRVHYLDWEIGPVFMQRRLETMASIYPGADENIFVTMFPRGEVEDAMRLVRDVGFFVIDPISAIRMEDENNNALVRRRLDELASVARDEHGASLLIVHHTRKQPRDQDNWYQALGEARGAGAFYDWVDGGMALRELDATDRTFELRFGTRGAETPDPMILTRDPETLTYFPKYGMMGEFGVEDYADAIEIVAHSLGRAPSQAEVVRWLCEKHGKGRSAIYHILRSIGVEIEG